MRPRLLRGSILRADDGWPAGAVLAVTSPWRLLLALAVTLAAVASSAIADTALDVRPPRGARVDGRPDRFVVCDRPGSTQILGIAVGGRVVSAARLLAGETAALDPKRCEPPAMARPSVQCDLGSGAGVVNIDVRLTDRGRRLGQAIFGDRWEYRALRMRRLVGTESVTWADYQIELPADEMFEDRVVRHVGPVGGTRSDACGSGFLVIRSHVRHGAALTMYSLAHAVGLEPRAVSEPLGAPDRWRDVVGIADVVGDGRPRIVEVTEPHLIGRLQVNDLRDGRILAAVSRDGYTTHRVGTMRQGIGALVDLSGDGIADIVVPTSDWKCLAVLTALRGQLRELGRLSCAESPLVDVLATDLDGDGKDDVVAIRADGTLEAWMR
ncbi:MAG TPA: hypothetical protein VJ890_12045 [Vineibacter sp.]|nr:hypothetical protein [Vineibacter sp.]